VKAILQMEEDFFSH